MLFKKVSALILALVIVASFFAFPINAASAGAFEVVIDANTDNAVSISPLVYNSGDEISLKLNVPRNTGVDFLKFMIYFDNEALEYIGFESNTLFKGETFLAKEKYLIYSIIMNSASNATGDLLTVNFKAKDSFVGTTEVYTTVFADRPANCKNGADNVPFIGSAQSLTFKNTHTSDGFSYTIADGKATIVDCDASSTVIIPEAFGKFPVVAVAENAFSDCTKLTDVYFKGTSQQWETIAINSGNENLTSANIYYNFAFGDIDSDGAINATDLTALRKLLLSGGEYNENLFADTNKDGKINILDLVRLKKYLSGMEINLGK